MKTLAVLLLILFFVAGASAGLATHTISGKPIEQQPDLFILAGLTAILLALIALARRLGA